MKTSKIKKDVNNIELCKIAAKNLGLTTKKVASSPIKYLLHVTNGKKFYLASAAAPGMFPGASRWYAHFTGSKLLSQTLLKQIGYNVIPSKAVRVKEYTSQKACSEALSKLKVTFPALVKPDHGMNSKNISVIEDKAQLVKVGLKHFRQKEDFMIQPIITDHTEYRIFVLNNKVELMHAKSTYHVLGDGKSTIKELLSEIIPEKTDATYMAWQHKKLGTKPTSVLEKGVHFEYHLTRGPSATFYETKKFPPAAKKWALELAKNTTTSVVGIDVFIPDDFNDTDNYIIIEINSNPGLHYLVEWFNDGESGIKIFENALKNYFNIK
ncbi:MAG: hypothetical protein ACI9H6_000160 [Patiriisocius sp.]|jgi:hypothetical protein